MSVTSFIGCKRLVTDNTADRRQRAGRGQAGGPGDGKTGVAGTEQVREEARQNGQGQAGSEPGEQSGGKRGKDWHNAKYDLALM